MLADEVKNPAMEKLELVRKWSLNTYKVCRQTFVCLYVCIPDMNLLLDWTEAFQVLYYCMKVICCCSEHKQECIGKASFSSKSSIIVSIFKDLVLSGKSFIGVTGLLR